MKTRKSYPGDIEVTEFKHNELPQPNKKDRFVQQVKEKFEQRSQTGIKKYNTTLERTDLNFVEWLNHLQEELMDATLYIERLKTSYAEEITKKGKVSLGE